ncbi:MAG: acylphosphatase [Gammaproteobacteria bacterium]|nr:acylphosphatase [Gammaproteobacteria bacterium]
MVSESRSYLVSGRVQGVGFRAGAAARATALALDGWVRNLADGRVEALARGNLAALEAFEDWLRRGPRGAAVSEVVASKIATEPPRGFSVRVDS